MNTKINVALSLDIENTIHWLEEMYGATDSGLCDVVYLSAVWKCSEL